MTEQSGTIDIPRGFDLGPASQWYGKHLDEINQRLPKPQAISDISFEIPTDLQSRLGLTAEDLGGVLSRFPYSARRRITLRAVRVAPPLWFSRESRLGQPKVTHEQDEALVPTALVTAYTDYQQHGEGAPLVSTITLYELPDDIVDVDVRRVVYLTTFAHELGHTIATPEIHDRVKLQLPDAQQVDALSQLVNFQDVVNVHPPISYYASAYIRDGKLVDNGPIDTRALDEQIAETISALTMGFVFQSGEHDDGFEPFRHRDALRAYMDDYLRAERLV